MVFKQRRYDAKEIAKALYLLGYRKIPENAVVLTGEEYDELYIHGYRDGKSFAERFYQPLVRAQARKETAEKFAERLHSCARNVPYDGNYYDMIFEYDVDEICKEITEKGV